MVMSHLRCGAKAPRSHSQPHGLTYIHHNLSNVELLHCELRAKRRIMAEQNHHALPTPLNYFCWSSSSGYIEKFQDIYRDIAVYGQSFPHDIGPTQRWHVPPSHFVYLAPFSNFRSRSSGELCILSNRPHAPTHNPRCLSDDPCVLYQVKHLDNPFSRFILQERLGS